MTDFVYTTSVSCSVCGYAMYTEGDLPLWTRTLICTNPHCTRRGIRYAIPRIEVKRMIEEQSVGGDA